MLKCFYFQPGLPSRVRVNILSEFSAEFWAGVRLGGRVAEKSLRPHSVEAVTDLGFLVCFGVGRSLTEMGHVLQKFLIFSSSLIPNPGFGIFIFLQLKLEFSSTKTTSETLLEEEKSVDFVFIPPETKPRILTEHQKEVLRSKRSVIYCFNLNVKCHSLSS